MNHNVRSGADIMKNISITTSATEELYCGEVYNSISVPLQRGHYGNISDNHLCNLKIMTDNFLTPNRR